MSKTWKKDTDDLFDFDTEDIEIKEMTLSTFNNKFYLVYYDEKLQLIDSIEQLKEKYKEYEKKEKEKEINKQKNNDNNNNNNNENNNSNENDIYNNNINNNQNNNVNNSNNNNDSNNSFLIVSEFAHISPLTFRINGPILSPELRKEIKDISILCRSWRLCKKNEENLITIGDVIKLGRARLKIDTICMGEIYESCQINNNLLRNKKKKNQK